VSTPPGPGELVYAVHTATCTYLLDEDGICQWVVSPKGMVPRHIQKAIGAQFVACLDLDSEGGLIGELRAGAMALFVRQDGARMSLLRTAPIRQVDDRRSIPEAAPTRRAARRPGHGRDSAPVPLVREKEYGKSGGAPYPPPRPPRLSLVEDLGEEQSITWTVPSFEPDSETNPGAGPADNTTAPRPPRKR
jgi:hypothetical protein